MTAAITRHDALTELSGGARLLAAGSKPIRRGALVCIAAGATLLVAASMTGSTASAAQQPAPIAVQPGGTTMMDLGSLAGIADIVGRAVASAHASPSASAHQSKHTAPPPTPADISGLAANGIPNIALNAYRVAAARLANLEPGCGVDWALLAGIGRVESDHGRFQNAVINADGTSTPPIIGPALNGHGTALIPAPANGLELAGDAVYTHALGPMQFIPQTWAIYGADASGDGVADIFNINDAALGAARYLCAAGGNLTTPTGQDTAVLAYNHLDSYRLEVLALADAYRRGIPISGVPIGNTTGSLPTVTQTGPPPEANPGTPTALSGSSSARAQATTPTPTPRSTPASTASTAVPAPTKPVPTSTTTAPSPSPTSNVPAPTSTPSTVATQPPSEAPPATTSASTKQTVASPVPTKCKPSLSNAWCLGR